MAGEAALLIPYRCLMYLVDRLSKGLMLSTDQEYTKKGQLSRETIRK
jgi:hypothetical protein